MKSLFFIPLFSTAICCAQVIENFSDGNFSANPIWQGDDSLFQVNSSAQLQSKGTVAKDFSLSTSSNTATGEWHFWCRLNLSPSASNYMRVYLMSDATSVKSSLNGYYVQLGGVTGSTDSITLYKQKGSTRIRIIGGRPGTVSKSNNLIRIKVLRDNDGNWQLFSDTTGGNNYILEGNGIDNEFTSSQYFGVFVRFTTSNAQNYYVDDVYAGPEIIDSTPPVLDSVQVVSNTKLRLVFNENLETISALNTAHYSVNNGIGNPLLAQFENGRSDIVLLTLNTLLANNTYQLTANNLSDNTGNIATTQYLPFVYYVFDAQVGNVLISEFFPDPTPVVGLPEQEFVELYNNTNSIIQLQGWTISDGTTTAILPSVFLGADSFLIVCASANIPSFMQYGKVVGLASLPSLNNSGDHIILKDNTGKIIHQLSYDVTWYRNTAKADGGYTIEMNNPKQLCIGKQNFAASDDTKGGTPGAINSMWITVLDTTAPIIVSATALNANNVQLVFSESMDSISLLSGSSMFTPSNSILSREVGLISNDTLKLVLNNMLIANSSTQVAISGMKDCSGNIIAPNTVVSFTHFVPDAAQQYDVLINEVLADPDPSVGLPDAEYIELYNRSDRLISLANWTLGDAATFAKLPYCILMPDSFVVVTSTANFSLFTTIKNVIGVEHFPNLGNDGDELTLKNDKGNSIHHLRYTSDAYKNNIKKNGGWSLELIDVKNPCGGNDNLAASIDISGGTMGRINSVKGAKKDNKSPKLNRAYPLNYHTVELRFDESMDSVSQKTLYNFGTNNGLGNPVRVTFYPPSFDKVALTFSDSIQHNTIYRTIVSSIKDCAGNTISTDDYADFGLPETIDSADIVINEILFDARGSGSDFVEIINRSDKIIDLKTVYIANTNEDNSIRDFYAIDTAGLLLFPRSYLVATDNVFNILLEYKVQQPKQLLQCKLPTFSNDMGTCVLMNLQEKRFDQLNYSDNMHFGLLDNKDGVSLERIDFNRPTSDNSNWTSASSTSGYATPTYQNSQYASTQQSKVTLKSEPEIFSPDGDGYNDVVNFSYVMTEPNFTANFYIYNSAGKMEKHLLRNQLLGATGVFSWDGITDDGSKVPIGIYICYFEVFNLKGEVNKHKISIVVAAKL